MNWVVLEPDGALLVVVVVVAVVVVGCSIIFCGYGRT